MRQRTSASVPNTVSRKGRRMFSAGTEVVLAILDWAKQQKLGESSV